MRSFCTWQTPYPILETVAAARALAHRSPGTLLIGASEGAKASLAVATSGSVRAAGVVSLSAERFLAGTNVQRVVSRLRGGPTADQLQGLILDFVRALAAQTS